MIKERLSAWFESKKRRACEDCGAPLVKIYYSESKGFDKYGKEKIRYHSAIVCSKYRNYNYNFDKTFRKEHGLGLMIIHDNTFHTGWGYWNEYAKIEKFQPYV